MKINMKIKSQKQLGFSLIEIMIALVIGVIMLSALIGLFTNFSAMNMAQNGLARLQENGRYVAMRMKKDIENVGFQPCATISMDSPQLIDRGFATRPLIGFTNLSNGLPANGLIDTQYMIQGHECDASGTCTPALGIAPGGDPYGLIPAAGIVAGTRAKKTDVITVRYIASEAVNVDDSVVASTASSFNLAQDPTLPPFSLENGNDILIANCFNALIVRANTSVGNTVSIPSGLIIPNTTDSIAVASVEWASKGSISSVYNFTKDFLTVSYYVGFKAHPDGGNKVISSLYRIENGNTPQELVEGVERFDLTYGVQFSDGKIAYLSASEVQATGAADCIAVPLVPAHFGKPNMVNGTGCLWRSVFSVRMNVLLNTVYDSSMSNSETFVYSPDGLTSQLPSSIPSGVNPGRMYRKEFTETITLQSNNL